MKIFYFQTSRRIDDNHVEETLCNELKNRSFSVQVDESKELNTYCKIYQCEWNWIKDFASCKEMPEISTGINMYNILSLYLKKLLLEDLFQHVYWYFLSNGWCYMKCFFFLVKQGNPILFQEIVFFEEKCWFQNHLKMN